MDTARWNNNMINLDLEQKYLDVIEKYRGENKPEAFIKQKLVERLIQLEIEDLRNSKNNELENFKNLKEQELNSLIQQKIDELK